MRWFHPHSVRKCSLKPRFMASNFRLKKTRFDAMSLDISNFFVPNVGILSKQNSWRIYLFSYWVNIFPGIKKKHFQGILKKIFWMENWKSENFPHIFPFDELFSVVIWYHDWVLWQFSVGFDLIFSEFLRFIKLVGNFLKRIFF